MKIAVIGAGAMGSIYGGRLSLQNDVTLIDTNRAVTDRINQEGLKLEEDGCTHIYRPKACTDASGTGTVDLVLLFVKSIFSKAALEGNRELIGPETRILTLQNGAGHEQLLKEFVPEGRVIIGTTEDNGAVLEPAYVKRGGAGRTNVGMLTADPDGFLEQLKQSFDSCGFQVTIHKDIRCLIWNKLFTNVSLSAVTGILQVDMGEIASNSYAWSLTEKLIHEAVTVAQAIGLDVREEDISKKVYETSVNNPQGCTSIRADLRDGRKTEVDTISGAVVREAKKQGISVPSHEFVVAMVHAMEEKNKRRADT